MSLSFVLSALALGYAAAGFMLVINLYRNGYLRGNILGIAASVIFFVTGLTYFSQIFSNSTKGLPPWLSGLIGLIAVGVIYGFIVLSFKNKFVIGGYQALAAARQQLRQQERWMQIMQENMRDGLAVFSLDGDLRYVNPAALRLLEINEQAMQARPNMMFGLGHKAEHEVEEIKTKVLRGQVMGAEIVTNRADGSERIIEVQLSRVRKKVGRPIGLIAVYRDITERVGLERAKEEFTQIASHELRTPLTAVKGFLSLLQMDRYGPLQEKQKELIDKADQAARRLSRLVDNLLVVARLEESRVSFNPEAVDIAELVQNVTQELAGEADRCAIDLKVWPTSQKSFMIVADKEKLGQVITNLVGNAIKYTPEGGHVSIEVKEKRGFVELSVSDTGVGIAKADLAKLFHKFERIRNRRSVQVGGSGLGLVIVKSFAELHGGHVSVSSVEGQGSTFTVILPVNKQAELPVARSADSIYV